MARQSFPFCFRNLPKSSMSTPRQWVADRWMMTLRAPCAQALIVRTSCALVEMRDDVHDQRGTSNLSCLSQVKTHLHAFQAWVLLGPTLSRP